MKKPIALFIALLLASLTSNSSKAEISLNTIGVGAAFAPIGGHGFSVKKLPESGFGFQSGTVFWKNNSDSYFNLGCEVLYVLRHTRLTALYIPVGVSLTHESRLQYRYQPPNTGMGQEYRETTTHFAGGAGLGFAARTENWDDLWFSLDLVMAADRNSILPLPQFGMHYFFH